MSPVHPIEMLHEYHKLCSGLKLQQVDITLWLRDSRLYRATNIRCMLSNSFSALHALVYVFQLFYNCSVLNNVNLVVEHGIATLAHMLGKKQFIGPTEMLNYMCSRFKSYDYKG